MNYIFLHVPKTAGTTFKAILERNFGKAAAEEHPLLFNNVYDSMQIDQLFDHYPYRLYSGHVFRLMPCLDACGGSLKLISFVRDPITKAHSAFSYFSGRDQTRSDHPSKRMRFEEIVEYVARNDINDPFLFDTSQVDWLMGGGSDSLVHIEQSVRSGRLVLFPTESFDLACVLLERFFPDDFSDCSYYRRSNVSNGGRRQQSAEQMAVAERLPWIAKDRELHQLAVDYVNSASREFIGDEMQIAEALSDFRRRCTSGEKMSAGTHGGHRFARLRRLAQRWTS
jgi:hypothetical protein